MRRAVMATLAAAGWFGLGLQLVILVIRMTGEGGGVADALWRFFAYFTILTNILVASSFTARALAPASPAGRFFSRPQVEAGVLMAILTVFVIYVSVLQGLWEPQGAQLVVDLILHYLVPLGFLGYWLAFVPHGELRPRHVPGWLAYPLLYALYALARGAVDGFYPYPFIDVAALGFPRVLINVVVLVAAFAVAGLILIGIDRGLGRLRQRAPARAAS